MAIVRYAKLRRIATTDEDSVTLLELSFCPTCSDVERYRGYGCPLDNYRRWPPRINHHRCVPESGAGMAVATL